MAATLGELAVELRVPYRTLASWVELGLVEPERRVGRQGVAVTLSPSNARELREIARLRHAGLSLQKIRGVMEFLRGAYAWNPLSKGMFAVVDRKAGRVVRLSENRQRALEVAGRHRRQYVMLEMLGPLSTSGRESERGQRVKRR